MIKSIITKRLKSTLSVPRYLEEAINAYIIDSGSTFKEIREDINYQKDVVMPKAKQRIPEKKRVNSFLDSERRRILSYGPRETLAYLASRFTSAYVANRYVFEHLRYLYPGFTPRSVLDYGSGPATSIWAFSDIWNDTIESVLAVEDSVEMTVAGKYLLRKAQEAAEADSKHTMLDHNIIEYKRFLPSNRDQKFDLIILSNILSELPNSIVRDFVIQELWSKCDGVLVVLENQGLDHFEIVERARSVALELGDCSIIAPCPHNDVCPLRNGKYPCEMKKRFWKLPLNMKIEQAKLNFEDSRFSYVVLRKGERTAFTDGDRIVANPLKGKKVVYLDLCTEEGTLKRVPITKNRGTDIYRAARKAEIGDTWDNQIGNSEDADEEFDDDD